MFVIPKELVTFLITEPVKPIVTPYLKQFVANLGKLNKVCAVFFLINISCMDCN